MGEKSIAEHRGGRPNSNTASDLLLAVATWTNAQAQIKGLRRQNVGGQQGFK